MSHAYNKGSGHKQPLPSYHEDSSASYRGNEVDPKLSPQTSGKGLRDHNNARRRRRPRAQTEASSGSSHEHQPEDDKIPEIINVHDVVGHNSELIKKVQDKMAMEDSSGDNKAELEMLKKDKEQAEKRNEELQKALRAAKKEKEEAEEQRNRAENMNRELQEALRAAVQKCWELNTRLGDALEAQRMLKEQLAEMIPVRLQGEARGTTATSKRGFLASIPWIKYREAVEEYKRSHRNPKER